MISGGMPFRADRRGCVAQRIDYRHHELVRADWAAGCCPTAEDAGLVRVFRWAEPAHEMRCPGHHLVRPEATVVGIPVACKRGVRVGQGVVPGECLVVRADGVTAAVRRGSHFPKSRRRGCELVASRADVFDSNPRLVRLSESAAFTCGVSELGDTGCHIVHMRSSSGTGRSTSASLVSKSPPEVLPCTSLTY